MDDMLNRLAINQDYFWFVALLLWGTVWSLWRWSRTELPAWRWVPWSAVGGGLIALTEIVGMVVPVRSTPGLAPDTMEEQVLFGISALTVGGWLWVLPAARRNWRAVAIGLLALLTIAGTWAPEPTHLGLAMAATAAGFALGLSAAPAARWAIAAAVLTFWLSSWGPIAEAMDVSRRFYVLSKSSVLWSSTQLLAAGVACYGLWRASGTKRQRLVPADWVRIGWIAALWLASGLILAEAAGRLARHSFEAAALARVRLAAGLMNRSALAGLLNSGFVVTQTEAFRQPSGKITPFAVVPRLSTPQGWRVRQELAVIEKANTDIGMVLLLIPRNGHLLVIPSAAWKSRADTAAILEQGPGTRWDLWSQAESHYQPPIFTTYGMETEARAPVRDERGRLLGWLRLSFPLSSWSASQAQARVQVFVIVALGLGVIGLLATQRVRTQERERARAEASAAARADQLKTTFLAKVSHELRTPIQSILGYAELLRGSVADGGSRSYLEAQRQHAELMLRLVNDLLDLSAIQAGAFRLRPQPTALIDLVRQATESLAPRATAKRLVLSFSSDPDVAPWATVDGERLRQVVLNLVTNAIKFTDHGEVGVRLEAGPQPGLVTLRVRDTGPGIAAEQQSELFRPFSRLESTAGKEGTGLGLAVAAALCRSMGGDIVVQSTLGEGTSFAAQFSAPACPVPAVWPAAAGTEVSLHQRRIVVADDNTLVRELFVAFLEERGAVCRQAADGEIALRLVEEFRAEAIVLDLSMPRMDGTEAARALRRAHGNRLWIVALSAHAGGYERDQALAAGADLFLSKPVKLSELASAVAGETGVPGRGEAQLRADLQARLSAQFRLELPAQRQAVLAALRAGDLAAVHARAHYLKNSAAVVGDDQLFEACVQVENATSDPDPHRLTIAWQACERALTAWFAPDDPRLSDGPPPPAHEPFSPPPHDSEKKAKSILSPPTRRHDPRGPHPHRRDHN